jgi:FAD:protein FMN transferase
MSLAPYHTVRLATHAMATRFELVLQGPDPIALRSAGEEAIREINRIGSRFSFYDPKSELSRVNSQASRKPIPVAGDLFELLQLCSEIYRQSDGYFDPTVGPLMRLWSFGPDSTELPSPDNIREVLQQTGWDKVELNDADQTVRFLEKGVLLDLGGIAKGWALDEAAFLLHHSGVAAGLLHGGTSSIRAIGVLPSDHDWHIGIEDPYTAEPAWFETHSLTDSALSVSAIAGKQITVDHIEYGHILDPKTGNAGSGPLVAVTSSPSAAVADAWSTAVLAFGEQSTPLSLDSSIRAWLYKKENSSWKNMLET